MSDEMIKEFVISMTDDDLLDMVEEHYYNYTPEALRLAIEELNRRNVQYRDMSQYFPSEEDYDEDSEAENENSPEDLTVLICPNCELEMKSGKLYLKDNFGSRHSSINCYFKIDDQSIKEIMVVASYEKKEVTFCCKCGLLIVNTRTITL